MANIERSAGPWRRAAAAGALLLYLLGVCTFPAAAQDKKDYALIYGTVWSKDDRVVPGIPIKIQRVGDKKPKWETQSDRRGEFAQRVPTGENDYIVIADIKMPKGQAKPQTKIHVTNNERVDMSLHLPQ